MLILVTLEPYAKVESIEEVLRQFRYGYRVISEFSRKGKYLLEVENYDSIDGVLSSLRSINEISHIVIIRYILNTDRISDVVLKCRELLNELVSIQGLNTFKVIVKRMFKKYPLTSIELAKIIGQELSEIAIPSLENPRYIIYIEVYEGKYLIGYSTNELYFKYRKTIPKEWVDRIIGIVENPKTLYEVMDLIQLSHALNVELRIVTQNSKLIDLAFEKLHLDKDKVKVKIYNDVKDALQNIDYTIVLTQYATHNEEELISIMDSIYSSGKVIGFVLGNEYDDVSLKARRLCNFEVRLGPLTGHPMRTSIALTYAIAITLSTWLNSSKRRGK